MTSKNNKIFIDPILDEVGRLVYPVHTYPSSDEVEVVLRKVPSRVVPVIFLPGVMGSNLRGVGDSQIEEIWRLDGVSSLLGWTMKDARERKNILAKYRKQFKYILVDEFQDTNYTQNVLVNTLVLGEEVGKNAEKQGAKGAKKTKGKEISAREKSRRGTRE